MVPACSRLLYQRRCFSFFVCALYSRAPSFALSAGSVLKKKEKQSKRDDKENASEERVAKAEPYMHVDLTEKPV